MTSESENNYQGLRTAFAFMAMLFFMWGALVSLNDILIPHFKKVFELNYTQTMLIQFCFFGAYFVMAVPASRVVQSIGFKRGIILGLGIIGIGCLMFLPAANLISYALFLFGLFLIATGSVVLQVVGNPYVVILGRPETASSRLNLAQGINSLGTTLAPLLGGIIILGEYQSDAEALAAVQGPYLGLALFAFLIAMVFFFSNLPPIMQTGKEQVEGNVLKFKQLRLGVIALTLYVGAEVTIGSFIVNFLGESHIADMTHEAASKYIPMYWGGLMVGRFVGSAILQKYRAALVLSISALAAIFLLCVTLLTSGYVSLWAMLLTGLFNSIMWSNIFALSIDGLGKYTIKGSGILVMAPVGGAIFPMLQGVLADQPWIGLHYSYILPLLAYAFILYYGLFGYKPVLEENDVAASDVE